MLNQRKIVCWSLSQARLQDQHKITLGCWLWLFSVAFGVFLSVCHTQMHMHLQKQQL